MTDSMIRKIGPWVLGRTLGQGGFGWVKDATHEKTGEKRAMKFMLKGANWNKKDEEEARNEIEALSKIKHKNVVAFFGFDFNCMYPMKEGANLLTVMFEFELASGGDLFDIIFFNPGGLREDIARYYFRQLIYSVKACHDSGVVHRDIKPQNLLLDKSWQLKLADFGLAKIFEADSHAKDDDCKVDTMIMTTYRGTPGYRAPEIELGRSYTATCDVFSCGVALFVLLTGYPPFKAPLPNDYWYQPMTRGNVRKFWRRHKHERLTAQVKDLLTGMFHFEGAKRLTMDEISEHPWFKSEVISQEKLVPTLKRMRSIALANYWKDPKRSKMNQQSVKGRPHAAKKKAQATRNVNRDGQPAWMSDADWDSQSASVRKCIKQMKTWGQPPALSPNRVPAITELATKANAQEVIATLIEFIDSTGGRCEIQNDYHIMGKLQAENWTKTGFELMEISVHVYSDPVNEENVVVLKRIQGAQVEFSKLFAMIMHKLIPFWRVDTDVLTEVKASTAEGPQTGEATMVCSIPE